MRPGSQDQAVLATLTSSVDFGGVAATRICEAGECHMCSQPRREVMMDLAPALRTQKHLLDAGVLAGGNHTAPQSAQRPRSSRSVLLGAPRPPGGRVHGANTKRLQPGALQWAQSVSAPQALSIEPVHHALCCGEATELPADAARPTARCHSRHSDRCAHASGPGRAFPVWMSVPCHGLSRPPSCHLAWRPPAPLLCASVTARGPGSASA